jgi:cytochrome c
MNKILVSIFFAVILVLGINKVTDVIFYVEKPEKSAYQVEGITTVASTTSAETSSESSDSDIMALFANADLASGKKLFARCSSCHNIANSKHKIGPSLKNIWRKVGSAPDYKYSKALSTYGKSWDVAELNGFLLNPKKWIPKNKMGFSGLKKPEDRAAVILYLNDFSDNPLPLQ